jgi:sterol desaturase/sphingolipid hydroxylase (fatty acid hydroxylase superfamily)
VLTWYISALCSTALVLFLAHFTQQYQIGLMPYLGAGPLASFLALLLVTQFIGYWIHVAFHRLPWLWPIHAIHHTDVDVDVSTSYRHHPLEPLVGLPLLVPAILLLGVPLEVAVAFKLFEVSATLFSHSNLRLPEGMDRQLRRFVLTPDYHRLHHCAEPRYTNSNYGSVVPWFDYLFGTASARPYPEQESMALGLEYLREPGDGRLDRLLAAPLRWKQATHPGADRV